MWSLAKDLKSFKLLFTIPAKGFVNSLQLITPSASQVDFTSFRTTPPANNGHVAPETASEPDAKLGLLVVGTTSTEPRLGRWMTLKRQDGVRNGVVLAHLKMAGQAELDERVREKERLEREKEEQTLEVAME